jgi:hypothetical protein
MRAQGPGWRSLEGLAWMARVGATSSETWARAIGWQGSTVRSHVLRLAQAGLIARVPRLNSQGGALLYPTVLGVQMSGVKAVALRRPPAPYTWAHHEACAQLAAYLTIRGRNMIAPRELLLDEGWVGELEWTEHGETRRRRHRPDFIATAADERTMAIEIELTPKSPERLRAVLRMYVGWLSEGRIDSLLYLVAGERERRLLRRETPRVGLERGEQFGVQEMGEITQRLRKPADEAVGA